MTGQDADASRFQVGSHLLVVEFLQVPKRKVGRLTVNQSFRRILEECEGWIVEDSRHNRC